MNQIHFLVRLISNQDNIPFNEAELKLYNVLKEIKYSNMSFAEMENLWMNSLGLEIEYLIPILSVLSK